VVRPAPGRRTIPERPRLTLAETLADSRVMAARQLRKVPPRRPMYLVYLFVQPVIFVCCSRSCPVGARVPARIEQPAVRL
jgi:hypothetical protein